jgi:hypothetical protein
VKEGLVGKFTWEIIGAGGREGSLTKAGFCICILSRGGRVKVKGRALTLKLGGGLWGGGCYVVGTVVCNVVGLASGPRGFLGNR